MTPVGRFAPSPSGRMHLGNVFAAMLAWLSIRSQNGRMLLRMEDLDPDRCRPEYIRQLRQDLDWLGFDWDAESPAQSTRTDAYAACFAVLEQAGLVYPCYCSRDQLHAASAPHASDGRLLYAGTCRSLTDAERAQKTKRPAWRLTVPDQIYGFTDGLFGPVEENLARECGDFIIRRADGVYAYQLAVVCDDGESGVTEVVRGCDLLDSTPRQLYLMEQLGFTPPRYTHVPLLTDESGRRLSKRDKDLDLEQLRQHKRPEDILGLLAHAAGLLEKPEAIRARDLVPLFDWSRVTTTPNIPIRQLLA